MQGIKYNRKQQTFHIHGTISSDIIYIHDLNVCLYRESLGTFSTSDYGIVKGENFITEAKNLFNGIEFEIEDGLSFHNVVKFELNEQNDIIEVVNDIKEYERTRKITKDFIDDMLNY